MKIHLLFPILILAGLTACEKKPTCASSMTLSATTLTPTVGDDVVITALKETSNEVFQWNGPDVNEINQSNTLTIDNIKLSQSGVYSCSKGNTDCNTSLVDTILIDVKLKQEIPPCTPAINVVTCSNIPSVTFSSVTKGFGGTFNTIYLNTSAPIGYPSFTVLFNSYNGNVEPPDGTYITSDRQVFDILQEPNEISISFIYASNFYHCRLGNKVYVKHVNGKLQVTFCNLEFGVSPGSPTTCSGTIRQS